MLRVENISKSFPGVKALDKVSVNFSEGEVHALLGENGAGKSTLIKVICGVHKNDEGKIYNDDNELVVKSYIDATNKDISVVNQELQVLSKYSVAENIMLDKMETLGGIGILKWDKINLLNKGD